MTTLDVLPDDVLYDVLYHSSVRDILALRQVSRKLYHVTHHRPICVNAYTRCPLLLPPGPFSYQSAVDLERMLKRGHLLEANWTSPSPRPISRQTFAITSIHPDNNRVKLVGRYLLMAGQSMFRCYDLESKNEEFVPVAVYDFVGTIFDCVIEKYSIVDSSDCQLLCALANTPRGDTIVGAVTLLRLHISQFSAKFELMKEVRLPRPIYRSVRIIGDILAMESACHGPMLLHIPTCQVYDVSPCDFCDNVMMYCGVRCIFDVTSNHLICCSALGSDGILEVFPLPRGAPQLTDDDETRSVYTLTRSHKCIHNYDLRVSLFRLLTERHDNDHTVHYTFVATSRRTMGFLDISLVSDLVTTTWTNAATSELQDEHRVILALMFEGSARASVYRLVALTHRREAFAFTASEDGDGRRIVRGKPVVVGEGLTKLRVEMGFKLNAFDGVQGRMCHLVSPGHLEVIDFV